MGVALREQAEDGPTGNLLTELGGEPEVSDAAAAAGPVMPGGTAVLTVTASGDAKYLTLTAMPLW